MFTFKLVTIGPWPRRQGWPADAPVRETTLTCESTYLGWPFADAKRDGTGGPFARLGYALTPPWIKAVLAAKYE